MNDFIKAVGGKKMIALIVYIILVCLKDKIGIGPEDFEKLSYTLMTYFVGQGFADGLSKGKTSHQK